MKCYLFVLLAVVLAAGVQHVSCPSDTWPKTPTSVPHAEFGTPGQLPNRDDPCDNHTVSCNPARSHDARVIIQLTTTVSVLLLIVPTIRVGGLEHSSRSESDTLFWWYLCLGGGGYFAWMFYFVGCADPLVSVFPIYVLCTLGALIHCILLLLATLFTSGVRDKRVWVMIGVLSSCILAAFGMWLFGVDGNGWLAFALTALSQSFRMSATNYRNNFKFWLLGAYIPIWVLNGSISLVGAINGFLWLKHPNLCLSLEYKLASYLTGLFRAWEAFNWCSRATAVELAKIEGETKGQILDDVELDLM